MSIRLIKSVVNIGETLRYLSVHVLKPVIQNFIFSRQLSTPTLISVLTYLYFSLPGNGKQFLRVITPIPTAGSATGH